MGVRIEHAATFDHPIDQVLSAMSTEEALTEQLAQLGGTDTALLAHSVDETGTSYELQQGVPAEKLPKVVRDLLPGDLVVHRVQTWQPVAFSDSARTATGTAQATVSGVPGEIAAETELTSNENGCVFHVTGEANVRLPLLGNKVERMIAEQVTRLLERESQFVADRLARSAH